MPTSPIEKPLRVAVAAVVVLTVVAAGCASEEPTIPAATPTTTAASPTTTGAEASATTTASPTTTPVETPVTTEADPDMTTADGEQPATATTTTTAAPADEEDPRAQELAEAMDVFTLVYDSDSPFDSVSPHLEDADDLQATHAEFAAFGASVGGIQVVPTAATINDNTATITFDVHVAGTPYSTGSSGALALRDGVWIAPRSEFCAGMQLAGISCPDPEPTVTTTTAPPESTVTTTTVPPEATTTTTAPADTTGQPQYQPGEIVTANELWPGNNYRDDFVCRINDAGTVTDADGNNDCWIQSWQHYQPGQIVPANELWPGSNHEDNLVCRINDVGTVTDADGNNDCWIQPTTTVRATVEAISAPLRRCLTPDSLHSFGSGHVAALVGTTEGGVYQPIVRGGEDSCERIKAWFDEARQAETDRINRGDYPCEYSNPPYYYWPRARQTAGPGLLVGCWPRLLYSGSIEDKLPDPDDEARRIRNQEGFRILPPNHPVLIDALWDCYRDALEGPPPGWMPSDPSRIEWTEVWICNVFLNVLGNPVRYLGVTPECAAEQLRGRVAERRVHGFIGSDHPSQVEGVVHTFYAGDYSWANCPTTASGLLSGDEASYRERCEAVVDASAGADTDRLAEAGGVDRGEVVEVIKDMFCADGTKQTLREQGERYQRFVPRWTQPFGVYVAFWTPGEWSVCYEAAMLVAAQRATSGRWVRVASC